MKGSSALAVSTPAAAAATTSADTVSELIDRALRARVSPGGQVVATLLPRNDKGEPTAAAREIVKAVLVSLIESGPIPVLKNAARQVVQADRGQALTTGDIDRLDRAILALAALPDPRSKALQAMLGNWDAL